jgi:hypothetical protein
MTDATFATLQALTEELPLAAHWGPIEPFVECVEIDGLLIHSVGLHATSNRGADVTGSAAARSAPPVERAYFELLERAAILDARTRDARDYPAIDERGRFVDRLSRDLVFPEAMHGDECRYSLSNGVAAARTVHRATSAARAELIERDRVLRSWFGGKAPTRHADRSLDDWCPSSSYDVEVYSFTHDSHGTEFDVAGMFAFPKLPAAPLVYGLAAAENLDAAIHRAGSECQQRLAFLWGESLPEERPPFEPTAGYHQDFYLWPASHAPLRAWLRGEHDQGAFRADATGRARRVIDLTPEHLRSRVWVVKALPEKELRLAFGRGHPDIPPTLQRYGVHPIA